MKLKELLKQCKLIYFTSLKVLFILKITCMLKKNSNSDTSLRQRGHDYILPTIIYVFGARNFIISSLFKYN
jgi:hypothetical protein